MAREPVPPLIAHLERHLGRMARGAAAPAGEFRVQLAVFKDQPSPGATAYATLGLSHHLLRDPSGREYRQELLGCSHECFDALVPEGNLLTIAADLIREHRALLRGEVVGPRGAIVPGSTLEAYYSAIPVYFPDALATFGGTAPPTVLVWLVPITHAEAHFVFAQGWSAFEDVLVERAPDLLDLKRATVV